MHFGMRSFGERVSFNFVFFFLVLLFVRTCELYVGSKSFVDFIFVLSACYFTNKRNIV